MQIKSILIKLVVSVFWLAAFSIQAQEYGSTEFEATGSREAHSAFVAGLLKMHNFEYEDARASFQEAISIDPDFTMAYWGEALSYEHSFWRRYDTEKSRAVLAELGATPIEREAKAPTEREKDYLRSIEVLFGKGTQQERELAYSEALKELHQKYPDDLDAAALYALSILVTTYGGRDYGRYMKAGAITEEILDKNPRHPGALHYNIHSYDDPIHAPLGLRSARVYNEVAPSAIHALHMGSHIYYALGMWEQGVERNIRSYEEAVARQADVNDPYGNQAYHALTWVPYGLQQMGKNEEAQEYIALVARQVERYGDENPVHRNHYARVRASYLVDTQDWGSDLADVRIRHVGLNDYAHVADLYAQGLVYLNRGELDTAREQLPKMQSIIRGEAMDGAEDAADTGSMDAMEGMLMTSGKRSEVAPYLLALAFEGQIALAEGNTERAIELISRAEQIEAALPLEYGPAVPVQPMAELLADVYRQTGNDSMAKKYYELSLERAVGRSRSLSGLAALN